MLGDVALEWPLGTVQLHVLSEPMTTVVSTDGNVHRRVEVGYSDITTRRLKKLPEVPEVVGGRERRWR